MFFGINNNKVSKSLQNRIII